MSICNIWIDGDVARVCVDTLGTRGFSYSKLIHLAHANVLLAGRGDRRFLHEIHDTIYLAACDVDFDLIVDNAHRSICAVIEHQTKEAREQGKEVGGDYFLAVVGWSAREDRMCAATFSGQTLQGAAPEVTRARTIIGPHGVPSQAIVPQTDEQFLALAGEQVQRMRELDSVGGGRLLLATLTKDELTVRNLGTIPA